MGKAQKRTNVGYDLKRPLVLKWSG